MKKALSVLLTIALLLSMCSFLALAAPDSDYDVLIFDPDRAPDATLTTGGVTYNVYRELYCTNPVPGINEGYFMLTIRVPVSYGDYEFSDEELAKAPILHTNPWGSDNGSTAPAATLAASGMVLTALQKGWVTVNVGMRGKSNVVEGYNYGKLPNPIADLKASLRYLHFNDDVMPGDAEKIVVTGTSSGGCATVMLGATGNTTLYDNELAAIGAYMGPGARDDIWVAAPSCAVTMRGNADPAIAWSLFGDLTDAEAGVDASELNKAMSAEFVRYLEEEMQLAAEYDVPEAGIEKGDALTGDNYADYLLPNVEASLLYYLNVQMTNNAGDKAAIETYLAGAKNTVTRGSWITPVFDDNDNLVDVNVTSWKDFWSYNSSITGNGVAAGSAPNALNTWYYQFDAAPINNIVLEANGVIPRGTSSSTGSGLNDNRMNASSESFGKPGDLGAVYSSFGIQWAQEKKGVTFTQEYLDLYEYQRNSVDPMYFLLNAEELGVTIAPNWVTRAGSADFVVPPPTFFALSTKLENMGYNVDALLTWDQGHGTTNDTAGMFAFVDELLIEAPVDDEDVLQLSTSAHLAANGSYPRILTEFSAPVSSNVAQITYTYNTDLFDYAGFIPAEGSSVSLLHYVRNDNGVTVFLSVPDYSTQAYGWLQLYGKDDAVFSNGRTMVEAAAQYVVKDESGAKAIKTASASTSFTTFGSGGGDPAVLGDTNGDGVVDLLDLSDMIDWYGYDSTNPDWDTLYIFFDFNKSGDIDIYDIAYVAQLII